MFIFFQLLDDHLDKNSSFYAALQVRLLAAKTKYSGQAKVQNRSRKVF